MKPELKQLGKYQLRALVSQRAIATTYEGFDPELGRAVWLTQSIALEQRAESSDAALLKAAAALSRLSFDLALGVIETFQHRDRVVVVTAAPSGESLRALIERVRARRAAPGAASAVDAEGARAALALCRAVARVHRRFGALGELVPEALFLAEDGSVQIAWPFGSRTLSDGIQLPEMGPHERYRSPEHVTDKPLKLASDVFCLGIITCELLTGRHPFDPAGQGGALSREIATSEPSDLVGPSALTASLKKALHKLPAMRHESAERLALDLELSFRDVAQAAPQAGLWSLPPLLRKLLVVSALMALVMGAAVLTRDPVQSSPARAPGSEKARVRVLAHPWADVYVDGQLLDTTPVGHPLLLSPGRHEIVFRHPRASEQRRSIEVAPGEALTVEVEMPVVRPPPPPVDSSP